MENRTYNRITKIGNSERAETLPCVVSIVTRRGTLRAGLDDGTARSKSASDFWALARRLGGDVDADRTEARWTSSDAPRVVAAFKADGWVVEVE